ncbi:MULTISPECIES: hypothetical protein [unclassified Moorena]|nr:MULTISPECIES: hypothetical protein [unclassified Moorena]
MNILPQAKARGKVSICATRTLREQPSAVSRQLKAHATRIAYLK